MTSDEVIAVGQLSIRYLRDGAKDKAIGAFEMTVPLGSNVPPPHSHSLNEEYVYILEGRLRYSVNELTRDLAPGGLNVDAARGGAWVQQPFRCSSASPRGALA